MRTQSPFGRSKKRKRKNKARRLPGYDGPRQFVRPEWISAQDWEDKATRSILLQDAALALLEEKRAMTIFEIIGHLAPGSHPVYMGAILARLQKRGLVCRRNVRESVWVYNDSEPLPLRAPKEPKRVKTSSRPSAISEEDWSDLDRRREAMMDLVYNALDERGPMKFGTLMERVCPGVTSFYLDSILGRLKTEGLVFKENKKWRAVEQKKDHFLV